MPALIVLDPQTDLLIRAGKKIQAIKLIRDRTGASLREAKDFVEGRWAEIQQEREKGKLQELVTQQDLEMAKEVQYAIKRLMANGRPDPYPYLNKRSVDFSEKLSEKCVYTGAEAVKRLTADKLASELRPEIKNGMCIVPVGWKEE